MSYMCLAIITISYHSEDGRWPEGAIELVTVYWTSS